MKNCAWCGRENQDAAVTCAECGTDRFKEPESAANQETTSSRKGDERGHFLWPLWNRPQQKAAVSGDVGGESHAELKDLPEPPAPVSKKPRSSDWMFFKIGDQERGPYTREQLRNMWRGGQVTADALCRMQDSAEWLPMLNEFEEKKFLEKGREKISEFSWPAFQKRLPTSLQNPRALFLVALLIVVAGIALTHHAGVWIKQARWEREAPAREARYAEARQERRESGRERERSSGQRAGRKMYQQRGVTLLWPNTGNEVRRLGEAIWTHPYKYREFADYYRASSDVSEFPEMKEAFIEGFLEGWVTELNQGRRLDR